MGTRHFNCFAECKLRYISSDFDLLFSGIVYKNDMKTLFFVAFIWATLWHSCSSPKASSETSSHLISDTIVSKTDSLKVVDFAKEIQPILQTHCSPCHFTGGKMYERMPFDKAETILTHQQGVLRRIKQEPDAQKIKDFFAQNSR